jgi:hypothetical protein
MADITLTWHEAHAAVLAWAHELPIYRGTGAPPPHAHVVVTTLDAWNGEGKGCWAVEHTATGQYVRSASFPVA